VWQFEVFDHFQAESAEADLPTRRAQDAQLSQSDIREDLRASAIAAPFRCIRRG